MAEQVAVLASIFDCAETTVDGVRGLARWSSFKRGALLGRQGDLAESCHVVVNGIAELRVLGSDGQHVRLTLLEPGDFFGAYPDAIEHEADIICHNAVEIASFETLRLRRLAREAPELGSGLAARFARQYGTMLRQFSARVTLTANGRVFGRLLERLGDGRTISPPPIVAALAVEAQTTRETASRAISILERRGIIERTHTGWTIVSPRMLEDLVV